MKGKEMEGKEERERVAIELCVEAEGHNLGEN